MDRERGRDRKTYRQTYTQTHAMVAGRSYGGPLAHVKVSGCHRDDLFRELLKH